MVTSIAETLKMQGADIAALARMQMEEKRAHPGTLKGISRDDEDVVFLARGCDRHTVSVCPQVVGKQLVSALKSTAVGAGGALRDLGWTQLMRNRLAIGLASAAWGGRSVQTLEPHVLGAADFASTTAQGLDEFVVPTRPRAGQGQRRRGTSG